MHKSIDLVNNVKLSDKKILLYCKNDSRVDNRYNSIEQCPNEDIYVGRHAPEVDGQIEVYDKDKNLINEWGGLSTFYTITPIYFWRTLTFQKIGCEEKEAKNYCK